MILDIYKDSFEFASRKISALLILGVLSFFNILIIPMVFFYGYNYRVVKLSTQSMINGEDVPPEFNDLKGMFIDGLKYIVVYFVYLIIPAMILVFSIYMGSALLFIIGFVLSIIASLFAYLAIAHMAENDDSLKSAFAFSDLFKIMSSIGFVKYIATYIGAMLISIVIVVVVAVLLSIIFGIFGIATSSVNSGLDAVNIAGTIIFNFVLFFIVSPYISLFQNRCQGLIYNLRG